MRKLFVGILFALCLLATSVVDAKTTERDIVKNHYEKRKEMQYHLCVEYGKLNSRFHKDDLITIIYKCRRWANSLPY